MTKQRPALSFAQAITRIAGVIGFEAAAKLVGRSDRAVRYWTEDDKDGEPTLSQALALDAAYRTAGGEGAPILDSYAAQLDVAIADHLASQLALTAAIGAAAQECGEAINHALAAAAPGATPAQVHRAITETEEASGRVTNLLRHLVKFLKPTAVAGSGHVGGSPT